MHELSKGLISDHFVVFLFLLGEIVNENARTAQIK